MTSSFAPSKRRFGLWQRAVPICAATALFSVGVAGADNSVSLPDRVGDSGSAPDIARLDVADYEGWRNERYVTFRVTLAGSYDFDQGQGEIIVALDTDQNPDTGSAFYGTEVEFVFQGSLFGSEATLYRSNGWDFRRVDPPEGWGWGGSDHFIEFAARLSDLGLAPDSGFNVVGAVPSPHTDTAPDLGTFNYQLVPGTTPPAIGPDTRAPHVASYPARAAHGKVAVLPYWVLDGRGRTAETVRIYRGTRLLKTIRVPLSDSNPFATSQVSWRLPRNLRGQLRYSVRSVDAAGNRSKLSWARLVIR
jgi:hypothetical protein